MHQAVAAFLQSGSSPPGLANYRIDVVQFRVVRETSGPPVLLSDPAVVAALAFSLVPDDAREHFGVLLLNTRNKLVAYHEVSVGNLSGSLVHPREVLGPALRLLGVASLILIHNHPSGDPTPSREDIGLTRQLVEGAKVFDLPVDDHVIVGSGTADWVSFAQRGLP
jgi:DNA repair protein RadC